MVDSLRPDSANLVGLIAQAVLYGCFQVLFAGSVYVILSGRTERINWHLLITAITMWVLITFNFAFSWSRIMDAFINLQPELRDDPGAIIAYFEDLRQWKEVTRTGVYVALTAVADALFIYRLYVVWGRNKVVVILPMFLLCGSLTAGIGIEVEIGTTSSDLFASNVAAWVTSFFSISLAQNLITTFLIVYRIWRVNMRASHGIGASSLWPVMTIILESGAIYSSTLLVLLATYASNSFSQYIAIDMLVPIIGITFSLIIVRVGLGISESSSRGGNNNHGRPISENLRLQRLNISVQKHITVDNDNSDMEAAQGIPLPDKEDGGYAYTQDWE